MPPLKVVFVMTFGEMLGGCEGFLLTFLRHVDRSRVEPVVIFNNPGTLVGEVASLGLPVEVIETGSFGQPWRGARAVRELRRAFLRERPGLIMGWFTKAQLYAAPAAATAGMRDRVAWFQHTLPGGTRMDPFATALPTRAVGASSAAGARAQGRMRPRRPTFVVLPGIDEPPVAPPAELAGLRESLGLPEGRAVVGIVGRMQPWKQQHLVVEAVAGLRAAGRGVHGLIVGGVAYDRDPDYYPSVRRRVTELGVDDAITFTDQVPDARPYIQLMDVLVNASVNEPFGIVLLEALALRVPVVAFDADGGPREVVEHGRTGLLARPGGAEDLTAQVGRLLADEDLRAALAERGRARFEERFTAERMARALEDELLRLGRGQLADGSVSRRA
jgi:glycosyltransferase involved in cell wall biosynthesis